MNETNNQPTTPDTAHVIARLVAGARPAAAAWSALVADPTDRRTRLAARRALAATTTYQFAPSHVLNWTLDLAADPHFRYLSTAVRACWHHFGHAAETAPDTWAFVGSPFHSRR